LLSQEIRKSAIKIENKAAEKVVLETILLKVECELCNAMARWIFCEEQGEPMPKMRPLHKDVFSEKYTLLYSAVDAGGDAATREPCSKAAGVCF
jgi:hypothetical protein